MVIDDERDEVLLVLVERFLGNFFGGRDEVFIIDFVGRRIGGVVVFCDVPSYFVWIHCSAQRACCDCTVNDKGEFWLSYLDISAFVGGGWCLDGECVGFGDGIFLGAFPYYFDISICFFDVSC